MTSSDETTEPEASSQSEPGAAGTSSARKGVTPRSLLIAVAIVIVVGALLLLALWYFLPRGQDPYVAPEIATLAEEDTSTVGFAAQFPDGEVVLQAPTGITTDELELYVAVRDAGEIAVFTFEGAFVETLAVAPGPGRDGATPVSIAFVPDGRLAVVDSAASSVLLFDPESPDEVTRLAEDTDLLGQPTAVTATEDYIIVADATDSRIELFTLDGEHAATIAEELDPALTFVGGLHVADGTLYVSDSNAGRVMMFDLESGEVVGALQQRLGLPRGVVTDADSRVLVADAFDAFVFVFEPGDFEVVDVVGGPGTARVEDGGTLYNPQGLVWDQQTRFLYVVDTAEGRVKVYEVKAQP